MAENYAIASVDEKIRAIYFSGVVPSPPLTEQTLSPEIALASVRTLPGIRITQNDSEHVFLEAADGGYTEMLFLTHSQPESASVGFRGGHIDLIKVIVKRLAE